MNSLQLPFSEITNSISGITSDNSNANFLDFWIEEPDNINLRQSGALICYYNNSAIFYGCSFGEQSFRVYSSDTSLSTYVGGNFFCQRFDSNSAVGLGISLARGKNRLIFRVYKNSSNTFINACYNLLIILNYTSGKHVDGDGAHNHTTVWRIKESANASVNRRTTTSIFQIVNIPESNYFITCNPGIFISAIVANNAITQVAFKPKTGEFNERGFIIISRYNGTETISQLGWYPMWTCGRGKIFKNYPQEPTNLMNIETERETSIVFENTSNYSILLYTTYHSITYTVDGTVTGFSGNGSGITVELYTDNRKVNSAVTGIGGTYSMIWYDDVLNSFTVARQDSTRTGRSE
jgi:hypothetical protein